MTISTHYLMDDQNIYLTSLLVDIYGAQPQNSTTLAPPPLTGTQVAQLQGNEWRVLSQRPPPDQAAIAQIKLSQWQAIKAKRDSLKSAGAQVGTYWFHTDADSRIQQLGLKDQARDVLAAGGTSATVLQKLGRDIPWQTLGGASTPMTVQLSFEVVAAAGDLDALCHYVALQHNAAMEASADPAAYDISTGWPTTFKPE